MSGMDFWLNYTEHGCKPHYLNEQGHRVQLTLYLRFHYVTDAKTGITEIRSRSRPECMRMAQVWRRKQNKSPCGTGIRSV